MREKQENEDRQTFVLVKEDVLDPKMVGLEAFLRSFFGRKALLEVGEEDPSGDSSGRIVEALEERAEGRVGGVAGDLALLQELLHQRRRLHGHDLHPPLSVSLSLRTHSETARERKRKEREREKYNE